MAINPGFIGRVLREPFMQFLILGTFIFVLLPGQEMAGPTDDADRIVVSSAEVERTVVAWTQRWQRPPTPADLEGMIREAVREQVLYREALALGLDRDDVVIRRHLRQKYEFVTQDMAFDTDPEAATLRAFHASQSDRYAQPARLTFSQILFSTDRRGSQARADAIEALADLQSATGPQAADLLGDAKSLASGFDAIDLLNVEAMFGPDFTKALQRVEQGRWVGPIPSGYGLHLVWVSKAVFGTNPPFEDVAQRVKDDWIYDQRIAANEAIYLKLLERYDVVVEPLASRSDTLGGGS